MLFSQENLANFQDRADSILLFKTSVSSHATKHNKGGVTLDLIYNNQNENNWHKWYFVSKIVLIDYEKKIVPVFEKKFWTFEAEVWEFAKILRSLEQFTILDSERSEQFLKWNTFFNYNWRFLRIKYIETDEVPIRTNNWDVENYRNIS